MSSDFKITLKILWGVRERGERGPKPGLTVERIVQAAIELADAEGLEAASMRRVADELGVGAMSLYRYVPGKTELLDLMLDAVHAATPCRPRATGGHGSNGSLAAAATGSSAIRGCCRWSSASARRSARTSSATSTPTSRRCPASG